MEAIPNRFIFMKVGNHAGEKWESILERKRAEIDKTGMSFWGYGGTACHPLNQVQPFARLTLKEQGQISLIMIPVDSNAGPEELIAIEYSADGTHWQKIPDDINVTGSRYALVLCAIESVDLEIDLSEFEVGVGPSRGKPAHEYVQRRIDKA